MMIGPTLICLTYRKPELFDRMAASVEAAAVLFTQATGLVVQRICVNQDPADVVTPRRALDRGWEVYTSGENLSFSIGNNRAAQLARGSVLVLVNNDLVMDELALLRMWEQRDAGIVGVVVRRFKDGMVTHGGGDLNERGLPLHLDRDVPFAPRTGTRRCWWTTFACVQIDLTLWRHLRGLDETYQYGYEDLDFCLRAHEHAVTLAKAGGVGLLPVVAFEAIVWHDEMGTRKPEEDGRNFERWARRWHAQGARLADLRQSVALAGLFRREEVAA